MVVINQKGRERYCEARLDTLGEVNEWIDQYSQFWMQRFDSLNKYFNKVQNQKPAKMKDQKEPGLKIVRHFSAPKEVVFEAFANAVVYYFSSNFLK